MKKTLFYSALLTAIIVLVLTFQRTQNPNIGIVDNYQSEITKQKELFNETQKKAETGDPDAQYDLGMMFLRGKGVNENEDKARNWFSLAAKQGHVKSKCGLIIIKETSWTTQFNFHSRTCIILFPEAYDEPCCCKLIPSCLDAGVLQISGKLGKDKGLII